MPSHHKTDITRKGEASRKFAQAIKHILSIPKEELAKREGTYRQGRAAKKASRNTKLQTLGILAFIFFSVGCASTHYVAPSKYPPKPVESVKALFQEPSRPYEVIAFVEAKTVTIFDKPEKMMLQARMQAAAVGADAVIFSSTGQWSGMPGIPGSAAGRAIKWK